jgi:spore germination protein YaaH
VPITLADTGPLWGIPTVRPRHARARAALLACLATTGLVVTSATQPAAADTTRRIVSGWLPYWTMPAALGTATENGDLWGDASPFWYQATSATAITAHTGAGDPDVVSQLRAKGIKVVPTVTETLDAAAMATLLASPSQRTAHVNTLVALVADNGYDGIDLDYESMNYGGTAAQKASVATGFVALATQLGTALDADGKLLSVTVGARTASTNWWPVHDYAALGKVADRFRIMAYDYSYAGGTPGAIAPLPWVKEVVEYAVSVVPANRIQLGVPLYGYDWPQDTAADDGWGNATSLTYEGVEALRTSVGATREWYADVAAPSFTYTAGGKEHQVWYSDQDSTMVKVRLVDRYGLQGVVFWAVGSEDEGMWSGVRSYATQNDTAFAVTAPALVATGTKVIGTGRLTRVTGGAGIDNQTVTLQRKDAGTTTWTTVVSTQTSALGDVTWGVTPTVNTQFRMVFGGTWSDKAVTSAAAVTNVKWGLTAAFADPTVSRGTTATLKGTVKPVRSGTKVVAQRLVGSTWTTVGTKTVGTTGSYSFSIATPTKGTFTYRLRVDATTLNAAVQTGTRVLTVS